MALAEFVLFPGHQSLTRTSPAPAGQLEVANTARGLDFCITALPVRGYRAHRDVWPSHADHLPACDALPIGEQRHPAADVRSDGALPGLRACGQLRVVLPVGGRQQHHHQPGHLQPNRSARLVLHAGREPVLCLVDGQPQRRCRHPRLPGPLLHQRRPHQPAGARRRQPPAGEAVRRQPQPEVCARQRPPGALPVRPMRGCERRQEGRHHHHPAPLQLRPDHVCGE